MREKVKIETALLKDETVLEITLYYNIFPGCPRNKLPPSYSKNTDT
jgi:hypothetical protein